MPASTDCRSPKNPVPFAFALATALCGALHAEDLVVPSTDFASIQAAVDAALDGDRIVVLPGTYHETVRLEEKSSIELIGKKGATIDADGDGRALEISFCSDIRVEGLTLIGAVGEGLYLSNSDRSVVERVVVSGATNSGIAVVNGYGNLVTDCRVVDSFNGVALVGPMAHVATGNRIEDVTNDGFFTYGSGHVITGNIVRGTADNAVQIGNNNAAIRVLVQDNTFSDLNGPAILFGTAAEACVLRDNIIKGGSDGVFLQSGASDIAIEDNLLVGMSGPGIRVQSGSTLEATGNRILKAGLHGVLIEADAGECLLAGNRIVKPAQSGVLVEAGASPARLTGNLVQKAGSLGFSIAADDCSLVFNRAKKSATADLEDTGDRTVLIGNGFATTSSP